MPTSLNFSGNSPQFVPSQLRHDSNGWYLTYYTYNPIFDGLERKRVRLNQLRKRCRSVMEFKLQVNDLMMTIDNQLRSSVMGRVVATQAAATVPAMNPKEAFFNSPGSTRLYEKFDAVASLYIEAKRKDTRPTTFRSYSSFTNIIRNWVSSKYPELKMVCFTRQIAIEFLEDMEKKNLGARTYNNMIRLGSTLFGWAVKKGYAVSNPLRTKIASVRRRRNELSSNRKIRS